ncbi:unnamed protein product [Brassica oleracea]
MEGSSTDQVKDVDWISKLPDDVLLVILSRLSTEEAVRTSLVSKRWEHVWKHISHLVLTCHGLSISKSRLISRPLSYCPNLTTLKLAGIHASHRLQHIKGSLSVSVDLNNPTEFERLQKVLRACTRKMSELEIIFKDNNDPNEENVSWNKKKNKYKDPFPNAEFRVDTVCMHNFSGSE